MGYIAVCLGAVLWVASTGTSLASVIGKRATEGTPTIMEGDILFQPDGKAAAMSVPGATDTWVTREVPYYIDRSIGFNRTASGNVKTAMKTIMDATSCIRFVPRKPMVHADYVNITSTTEGCYSAVGRRGGQQIVNIGSGCGSVGIIMHELLHALGFWHEQSRSDRDQFVDILKENIEKGKEDQFSKRSDNPKMEAAVKYDIYSILHYKYNEFAKDSSLDTILPKPMYVGKKLIYVDKTVLGQRDYLSKSDIERVKWLYQCGQGEVVCSAPNFGNVKVSPRVSRTFDVGKYAFFSCVDGYNLIGPRTSVCKADGKWSGAVPFCIKATKKYIYCDMDSLTSSDSNCGQWRIRTKPGSAIWQQHQGQTDTLDTGPLSDHTVENSTGSYFYMEASGVPPGSSALMFTPYISKDANTDLWSILFYTNMYGGGMGTLKVSIMCYGRTFPLWSSQSNIQTSKAWQQVAVKVDLKNTCFKYSYITKFAVLFEAIRGNKVTSDIAIDDVFIASSATVKDYTDVIKVALTGGSSGKEAEYDGNLFPGGVYKGTKF